MNELETVYFDYHDLINKLSSITIGSHIHVSEVLTRISIKCIKYNCLFFFLFFFYKRGFYLQKEIKCYQTVATNLRTF